MTTDDDAEADLIASRVSQTPIARGSSSFRSYELTVVDHNLVEFRPAFGARSFELLNTIGPFLLPFLLFSCAIQSHSWLCGAASFIIVVVLVRRARARVTQWPVIEFRLAQRRFRRPPADLVTSQTPEIDLSLDEVHAIQVLKRIAPPNEDTFDWYELNLVLRDGSRVNVFAHADRSALHSDATQLAARLALPLWFHEST